MKTYEITFITLEAPKDNEPVKELIQKADGKIVSSVLVGEKTFTYPINKQEKGFYSKVVFEIEGDKIDDINKKLTLNEDVLRFLLIFKKPSDLLEAENAKIRKAARALAEANPTIPAVIEEKKSLVPEEKIETKEIAIEEPKEIIQAEVIETKKPAKTAKPAKEVKKEAKTAAKPVVKEKTVKEEKVAEIETETQSEEDRLKELDKKLDELLKE